MVYKVVDEEWGMIYTPSTGELIWSSTLKPVGGIHKRKGYLRFQSRKHGRQFAVHRVICDIMGLDIEGLQVDHINGDRADNRWENLRIVTPSQNRMNTGLRGNGTGYKNVYKQSNSTWIARVIIGGKRYQSSHSSAKEASLAAVQMRAELQGEYACER